MKQHDTQTANKRLAQALAGGGLGSFIVLLVFLYATPSETLRVIDNINIKALLFVLGCLVLTAIGVLLYWLLYSPTVRRLTVVGWRAILVYSAIAGGFSVFGWPRLKSFNVNEQEGVNAQFSPLQTSLEVWPNLAVCFAGIIVMTLIYILVGWLEAKIGQEL